MPSFFCCSVVTSLSFTGFVIPKLMCCAGRCWLVLSGVDDVSIQPTFFFTRNSSSPTVFLFDGCCLHLAVRRFVGCHPFLFDFFLLVPPIEFFLVLPVWMSEHRASLMRKRVRANRENEKKRSKQNWTERRATGGNLRTMDGRVMLKPFASVN